MLTYDTTPMAAWRPTPRRRPQVERSSDESCLPVSRYMVKSSCLSRYLTDDSRSAGAACEDALGTSEDAYMYVLRHNSVSKLACLLLRRCCISVPAFSVEDPKYHIHVHVYKRVHTMPSSKSSHKMIHRHPNTTNNSRGA